PLNVGASGDAVVVAVAVRRANWPRASTSGTRRASNLPEEWAAGRPARVVLGARGILPAFILNWLESTMGLNSLRLLIVDDEEAARYGMRRALETFRCEIAEAESAEAARAL